MAQEIFVSRQSIRKASSISILGLSINSTCNADHSIEQRRTAALAKWFSLDRDVCMKRLSIETIYRLHNQMFVPSMAYGLAALPMATSLLQHVASSSTTHLLRYHKRPSTLALDVWIHRTRKRLRERRLNGDLITPLRYMASDLMAMSKHCASARGSQLDGVIKWRDRVWMQSVPRQHRPQQRKGGDFSEAQLLATDLEYFSWLRLHVD